MGYSPAKLSAASLDAHNATLYQDLLLPLFHYLGNNSLGCVPPALFWPALPCQCLHA